MLRSFFCLALTTLVAQQLFSAMYFFLFTDFFGKEQELPKMIGLLLISACYSFFQFLATMLNNILIGLKKYQSASYLPIIPSTVAAIGVACVPNFFFAICILSMGSALQVIVGIHILKSVSYNLGTDSEKIFTFPSISTYCRAVLQYVFLSAASITQKSLIASNSLSAFSLFSVAERSVLAESTISTRGFNQVTIAEVMRLDNNHEVHTKKLLELLRSLCLILMTMSITFYVIAPPVLSFIYLRGEFSEENLKQAVELMKLMQIYICAEAVIVFYSNFLFNIKKFKAATYLSYGSSVNLVVLLLLFHNSLTPKLLVEILTINSLLWLLVRFACVNQLLNIRSREITMIFILILLSVGVPTLAYLTQRVV